MQRLVVISPKTLWSAFGLVVALAVLWLIVGRATSELVLMFSAVVIAEGMRPLVHLLERWRWPQALAILAVLAAVIGILVALVWVIIAPLTVQIAGLLDNLPQIGATLQHWVHQYQQLLHDNRQARGLLDQIPGRVSDFLSSKLGFALGAPFYLIGLISNAFLLALLVFFWLTASKELAVFVLSFVPRARRPVGRAILDELSHKTGGYVRGVLINMIVIGALSGFGVFFLGVPYALLLGLVAGLTESIPIVGPLLGGSVAIVVAAVTLGWGKALQVVLLYVVIQQIEGNTLVPLVMNRVVDLNPLTIIVALFIGSALLGIPGAILSVPAAAIVQVLVIRLAAPAARKALAAS